MLEILGNDLLKKTEESFISKLSIGNRPSKSQIASWKETYKIFTKLISANACFHYVKFVFEYKLPFTGNSRTDVLMFINQNLYLIEFKNRGSIQKKDIDQIIKYRNELANYHSEGRKWKIKPILLLKQEIYFDLFQQGIPTCSSKSFIEKWGSINFQNLCKNENVDDFIKGRYNPSDTIIEYAKKIFNGRKIKGISKPLLKDVSTLYRKIKSIIENSQVENLHSLILVTGAPGSGKSALALKIAHNFEGLYINKNNFFIKLLTSQLNHKVNLLNTHSVLTDIFKNDFEKNVLVIDEAQRVWESAIMKKKYNIFDDEKNILIHWSTRLQKRWSCTIAFIGHDQQIGRTENSLYDNWIKYFITKIKYPNYRVFFSDMITYSYNKHLYSDKSFHLKNSLRSFHNNDFSEVVNNIIEKPLFWNLSKLVQSIKNSGFNLIITRDLKKAINFVNEKYENKSFKTCLIGTCPVSDNKEREGEYKDVIIDFNQANTINPNVYLNQGEIDIDYLKRNALSQYQVLGLEFEIPIIMWNEDYLFYKDRWNYNLAKFESKTGFYYVRNSYRIFLTRGKNGVIIYIPIDWYFNNTYGYFKSVGFDEI